MKKFIFLHFLFLICTIACLGQAMLTAPVLMSPTRGEVLDPRQPIRFHWSMVAPAGGFFQNSTLRIVEILPGQSIAQAIRSNMPLIQRQTLGMTQAYLTPMDIPFQPGDSMHLAWTISPAALTFDLDTVYHRAVSQPEDFWLTDGLHGITRKLPPTKLSDCGLVDAGPNHIITEEKPGAVVLGAEEDENHKYEWISDPLGYHGYQSHVEVSPVQTTRYILIRTDSSTGCKVYDDVWVSVKKRFAVDWTMDVCGTIRLNILPWGTPIALPKMGAIPTTIKNGVPYDQDGAEMSRILPLPPSEEGRYPEAPQAAYTPVSKMTYRWSNGSRESSYRPKLGDGDAYTVTVSNGFHQEIVTIQCPPSTVLKGDFPVLKVPKKVALKDARAFVIQQLEPPQAGAPQFNAMGYRLTIYGPANYEWTYETYSPFGLQTDSILWDQSPDFRGLRPVASTEYYWRLSLINCDCEEYLPFQRLRIRKVNAATLANSGTPNMGREIRRSFGKFEVVGPDPQPQNMNQR
jgi:hypothetical protein